LRLGLFRSQLKSNITSVAPLPTRMAAAAEFRGLASLGIMKQLGHKHL
tara:strand:- start:336 stop:479 length:144 start_codon:yes stop_codon:yes gene_type:complete